MAGIAALAAALAMLRHPLGQLLLLFLGMAAGAVALVLLGDYGNRWLHSRQASWANLLRGLLVPIWVMLFLGYMMVVCAVFIVILTAATSSLRV
jgi:hypothetical protein